MGALRLAPLGVADSRAALAITLPHPRYPPSVCPPPWSRHCPGPRAPPSRRPTPARLPNLGLTPISEQGARAAPSRRAMPMDQKRKRWASCGVCSGCLASDCGASPSLPARCRLAILASAYLSERANLFCGHHRPVPRAAHLPPSHLPIPSTGECINCSDKSKFGGQGVRKQSCVMRRCIRLNDLDVDPPSSRPRSRDRDGDPPALARSSSERIRPLSETEQIPDLSPDQALFWSAVTGITSLNAQHSNTSASQPASQPSSSDDESSPTAQALLNSRSESPRMPSPDADEQPRGRGAAGKRGAERDDAAKCGGWRRPAWAAPGAVLSGADVFCSKLATVLVRRPLTPP